MPFARPTLTELIARAETDIQSRLKIGPLVKRTFLYVFARVTAGAAHGLYGYLDWVARQLMPDTADVENLERWASIWGLKRNAPTYAAGIVTITGVNGSVLPAGAYLQRSDGVIYVSDAERTIAGGSASVPVTALLAGAAANAPAGQALSLVVSFVGISSSATSSVLSAGSDAESDTDLRVRLLARIRQAPHGGAAFDYIAWAKEITGVTRAWVYPNFMGVGTVGVAVVTDDAPGGPIPSSVVVNEVQSHINDVRPVTADVTVFAPVANPLNPQVRLFPNTTAVQEAVRAELAEMLQRDAEPGGTILLSRIREAVSVAAGESDNTVLSPSANFVSPAGSLPTLGTVTFTS